MTTKAFPLFDLHCDTALELYLQQKSLAKNDLQVDLARASQLRCYRQVFAFCCVYDRQGRPLPQPEAERLFLEALQSFQAELRGCNALPLLALEGPEAIDCDPARLEWLYAQGFRMTTLTWNYRNALAGSCLSGEGLTAQGRDFVRKAQRLGIVLDVSHLSDRAFWDLVEISEQPIVASHSNSRACCGNPRNLTDDQFRAIRDLGGLVGMNLYAPFLSESGCASFDDVRRHLDHWLSLDGGNTVALGGDLDGCDTLPQGFTGVDDYNRLGAYLIDRGLDDKQAELLFYGNAARFFPQ